MNGAIFQPKKALTKDDYGIGDLFGGITDSGTADSGYGYSVVGDTPETVDYGAYANGADAGPTPEFSTGTTGGGAGGGSGTGIDWGRLGAAAVPAAVSAIGSYINQQGANATSQSQFEAGQQLSREQLAQALEIEKMREAMQEKEIAASAGAAKASAAAHVAAANIAAKAQKFAAKIGGITDTQKTKSDLMNTLITNLVNSYRMK